MAKVKQTIFAILVGQRDQYRPVNPETGQRPVTSFRIDRTTKNLPTTKPNEVAVKLTLTLDNSIFDKLVPVVEIDLGERDLFVNTLVEINGEAVPQDEPDDDSL